MNVISDEQMKAVRLIAAKPHDFYTGYFRDFATRSGEGYAIDTRYDDELRAIGLLPADAPKPDGIPQLDQDYGGYGWFNPFDEPGPA